MRKFVGKFILLILLLNAGVINIAKAQLQSEEQQGVMYYNNREYEKAVAVFEPLFNRNPSQFNYLYYVNSLFELKDFDKAEKAIKKLKKNSPGDLRYEVDMGYLLILQGETAKGRKIYDNCLKNLPADKNQIYNLSYAFNSRRETDYTLRTYQRGRELLKDPTGFAFELAYMHEALGNSEQMIEEYLNLLLSSPQQMSMVQNRLQTWLSDDPENTRNETYHSILLKKSQENPDIILYNEMLLWHAIQQKDFPFAFLQAKALDRRFNESGKRIFDLAALSASNLNYQTAIECYKYLIKKNSNSELVSQSQVELTNTEFKQYQQSFAKDPKQLLQLETSYTNLITNYGKSSFTIPLILNLSHLQTFYLQKHSEAIELLNEAIAIPNLPSNELAECKIQLADIYLYTGEQWEATLLYSQVEKAFKNEPLGHEAKFRNARLSYYIGEFEWANAQLDILKAATSKLISNDALELSLIITDNIEEDSNYIPLTMFAHADLLLYQGETIKCLQTLDSIQLMFPTHPINDDILYKKAALFVKEGKYTEAEVHYNKIIENYSFELLADDAVFDLASLFQHQLANNAKAMELYQKILTQYPGSLYVVEARKQFRLLRNDQVN